MGLGSRYDLKRWREGACSYMRSRPAKNGFLVYYTVSPASLKIRHHRCSGLVNA